jgi:hypothetical protein
LTSSGAVHASHALPWEKPELTNRLVLDFLADEHVPKMLPAVSG